MNNLMLAKLSQGIAIGILAGIGLGFEPINAAVFTQSTPLSQLLAGTGNQLQVEDKLFSDFLYAASGGAQPVDPANVSVSPFPDGPNATGILITGAFFSDSPDGDIALGYTVNVLDPDLSIVDAELSIAGISSGQISIAEDVRSEGTFLGDLLVNNTQRRDTIVFEPVQTLNVLKNIELRAEGGVPDSFSIIDQLYSQDNTPLPPPVPPQSVPESTAVLALLGLGSSVIFQKSFQKLKK